MHKSSFRQKRVDTTFAFVKESMAVERSLNNYAISWRIEVSGRQLNKRLSYSKNIHMNVLRDTVCSRKVIDFLKFKVLKNKCLCDCI